MKIPEITIDYANNHATSEKNEIPLALFVPLVVKLSGEGDNLAVGLYEFDGLAFQFGEDGHGFLFGEVLTEGFKQQVIVYGDGAVVGIKG